MILRIGLSKNRLGKIKTQRCSWVVASMIREITRSRLLARDRVSHDALLGFQQSVHFLIASILIVPGDEFGMRDEPRRVAGNSEIAMTRFE
jgi:hypothetical protein